MRFWLALALLALTGIVVFAVSGDTVFFPAAITAALVIGGVNYARARLSHPHRDSH